MCVLFLEDDSNSYRLEFTDDCIDEAARFTIRSSGIAEHRDSGKCLAIKKKSPLAITLELMNDCNSNEAQLTMSVYPPKGAAHHYYLIICFPCEALADRRALSC